MHLSKGEKRKMKTIYKYKIRNGHNRIKTYKGANFISTGQDCEGFLCVWAEIDTDNPEAYFGINCIRTGWDLNLIDSENYEYIGTTNYYPYIWHVYNTGEED